MSHGARRLGHGAKENGRVSPTLHKDPFDRILIAQAKAEGLTLVTNDGPIREYPVQTLW